MSEEFNFPKFWSNLNNPDDDYAVIALNDLIKYMEKGNNAETAIPIDNLDLVLTTIVGRINDELSDIVTPTFRVITFFAEKLPISHLGPMFDYIFEEISSSEAKVIPQVNSVIRVILNNSITFTTERQQKIIESLFPKLEINIKQLSDGDLLFLSMDVLSVLVEVLGSLLSDDEIVKVFNLIKLKIETENSDVLSYTASLAKTWTVYSSPQQLNELLEIIFDLDQKANKVTLLSAMVTYRPILYQEHVHQLITTFIPVIQEVGDYYYQESQTNEDFSSSEYSQIISSLIESIGSLTNTFPNIAKEDLNDLLGTAFQFMAYGANTDYGNDEQEGEEMGIEDELVEELDDPDDNDANLTGDDSWKIRKSAINFCNILMHQFPDDFYNTLIYQDDDVNNFSIIDILLRDGDTGVQKDAIEFLKTLTFQYKENLGQDNFEYWISTVVAQMKPEKEQIIETILNVLSTIIKIIEPIPTSLAVTALNSIFQIMQESFTISILNFISVILEIIQNDNEIIEPIGNILNKLINETKVITPTLGIISRLFDYSRNNLQPIIEELVQKEIQMVSEPGEKMTSSILSLCVFIVSFPNTDLAKKSLEEIINKIDNEAAYKVISSSISLIIVSESRDMLSQYLQRLFNEFYNHLTSKDTTIVYRSLWAIKLLLESELGNFNEQINEQFISSLIEIITNGDSECQLLSLIIMSIIPGNQLILRDLQRLLLTRQFNDEYINIILKIISNCSEEETHEFIHSFLEEGKRLNNPQLNKNISRIIGNTGNEEFSNNLLIQFENLILNPQTISPLIILCIGELSTHINVSSHTALVDKMFELAISSDRSLFTSSSVCIGLMSIGSTETILERLLQTAKEDNTKTASWILSLLTFSNRITSNITDEQIKEIFDYLCSVADYNKETASTISQILSILIRHDYNLINDLLNISANNELSGPVALSSIQLYLENAESEIQLDIINKIIPLIDRTKPILTQYIIGSLKICLNNPNICQQMITFFDKACSCVETLEEHSLRTYYGNTEITKDIGLELRTNAIDSVMLYFKYLNDNIDKHLLLNTISTALRDNSNDIQLRGYILLADYAQQCDDIDELQNIVPEVLSMEQNTMDSTKSTPELERAYLRAIVCLHMATEKHKVAELEQCYVRIRTDTRVKKIELDLTSVNAIGASEVSVDVTGKNSVNYKLMLEMHPEAATIFAN
ncbi:hypothetical protein GPJ56_009914 [Histomonas meleagridis]|uniref:uncharacterized protein n=1 Tax=Histomonas meleagridis TaxID=135588 RepID=UPI00355A284E|nr:hypothetical protein GPJ56_009914 [Histomonas meleagridis]KAH0802777.1 hypothetical protein GO595_004284 [Histomonas meleagridis]